MNNSSLRVLVSPLDWGLGHASRCVPVISAFQEQGAEVIIGASGGAAALLKEEFPAIEQIPFPPYAVRYSTGNSQIPTILRQVPRLSRVIRKEHKLLKEVIRTYDISGIISDNRYGMWSKQIPSVFICHQLSVLVPASLALTQEIVDRMHRFQVRLFDEIWVPDVEGSENISGKLAHNKLSYKQLRYLGPLSRFAADVVDRPYSYKELNGKKAGVLLILSGPEPQRTLLEEKAVRQAEALHQEVWIVQGKAESRRIHTEANVKIISFMNSEELRKACLEATVVISRSGYSSLMDYVALDLARVLLIPTPGQTEQEYLGQYMEAQKFAACVSQQNFSLEKAWDMTKGLKGFSGINPSYSCKEVVASFLSRIREKRNGPDGN